MGNCTGMLPVQRLSRSLPYLLKGAAFVALLATGACSEAGNSASDGGPGANAGAGGDPASGGGSSAGGTTAGSGAAAGTGASASGGATSTLVIEEDDPSLCGALGEISTAHAGYGGAGFFDGVNKRGASLSWIVDVPQSGTYELGIRFANGGGEARGAELRVAHEIVSPLAFPASSDWTTWSTDTQSVELEAGVQHISVVASTDAGLPNIDSLSISGAEVSAARCDEYAPGASLTFDAPTFQDASVHDPSVIDVGGTRYVFGSHLAAAKTTDFLHWTVVASDGVTPSNPLFDNVVTELSEAFAWSTVTGLWAADVLQLKSSGKYLMYYNSCKGDEAVSAMGVASASQIEGPYTDSGLFLKSGFYFHNQNNPDGSFNNTAVDPNAIDPDAFYDATGRLWIVYGSYSGGIFILELNPATGLPLANQPYYGKHLLGGGHAPIEGPYIQYSPESGYYYLFTSYGGLLSTDGYNVRIARSKTPDGPYYDAAGVDQVNIKAPGDITVGGVKILGNHQWAGENVGYLSAGHNSAYYDATTGQQFIIFHTRFPGAGEFHQLRVHEMFVNLDGWLLAAPLRYAPRSNDSGLPRTMVEYVGLSEVGGTYQMVNHGRDMSGTSKQSATITLSAEGSVSGAATGTWRFGGNNVISLELGGALFTGVLSRQWNEGKQQFTVTLTALNASGEALWAVRTGG